MDMTFKASKVRQFAIVLLGIGFVCGYIWWWFEATNGLWGLKAFILLGGSFFALCTIRGAYVLANGMDQLEINTKGFHAKARAEFVPWTKVKGVYTSETNRQKFVCFDLEEDALPNGQRHWLKRILTNLNSRLGFGQVQVATSRYSEPHEEIIEAACGAFRRAVPNVSCGPDGCWRKT